MKKYCFILFTLFSALSLSVLQAQDTNTPPFQQQPVLKITGSGELRVVPDEALMNMTVKATDMDLNQAVKKLHEKTSLLQEKLQEAGFKPKEIKTSQLSVQENGKWRNGDYIDSGYAAMQHIELRFKRDQQRILSLMEAFAGEQGAEALFHFGFALSDEARKDAREELIRRAILDARSKATVIAKTSGVKLGKIRSMVYGQPDYQPGPVFNQMSMRTEEAGPRQSMADMEVREIEMRDDIVIYWDIE